MATASNQALSINMVMNSAIDGANFLQVSVNKLHTYATKVQNINLLGKTNFRSLTSGINKLNNSLKTVQNTTNSISNKKIKIVANVDSSSLKKLSNTTTKLKIGVALDKNSVSKLKSTLSSIKSKKIKVGVALNSRDVNNSKKIANNFRNISTQSNRASKSIKKFRKELQLSSSINLPSVNNSNYNNPTPQPRPNPRTNPVLVRRTINTGDVMATTMATAPIVMPLASAIRFESAITSVEAKTDTKYAKDIPLLRETALNLGSSTEWTMSEVAKGQEYMTMAGFNPKQIKSSMGGVLALATVGDMDLGSTADIGSNVLSGFSLKANKMDMVADKIAKTITTSNVNISEIGNTMKYTATVANSLRGENAYEETLALTGQLGNIGIKGTQAGTALKGMYLRLATPTKEGSKELAKLDPNFNRKNSDKKLKSLGVSAFDKKGNFKPLTQTIGEIKKAFVARNYSKEQETRAMKSIFGMIVAPSATGLLTIGQEKLEAYQKRVNNSVGEAKRIQMMKLNTVAGQFKLLTSATDGLSISVSNSLLPPLKNIVKAFTLTVAKVQKWSDANPKLSATLYGIAVVGAIATVGIMALGLVATLTSRGMAVLSLSTATTTARVGFLNRVISRSPLIMLATLVLGAVYSFKYFESVIAFSGATLDGFAIGIEALKRGFSPVLSLLDNGATKVKEFGDYLGLYSINTDTAVASGNSFGTALAMVIPALIGVKVASLALGSPLVKSALMGTGVALRFVGTSALWMGRAFLLNPIGVAISAIVAGALLIQQNWGQIKPFWTNLWNSITTKVSTVWGSIKGAFNLKKIKKYFFALVAVMATPFVSFFGWITKKFSMVSGLMGGVNKPLGLSLEEKKEITFKDKKALAPAINNKDYKPKKLIKPISLRDSLNNAVPLESPSKITDGHIKKFGGDIGGVNNKKSINQTNTFNNQITIKAMDNKVDEVSFERQLRRVQRKVASEKINTSMKDVL